jgi:hypothetical protein
LTLNADGSFSYTPDPGWLNGDNFIYAASDGTAFSKSVVVSIIIEAVPVATNDLYNVPPDTPFSVGAPGVLANDTDANTDQLTAVLISQPNHGSVALGPSGGFTYIPDPGFRGSDSFQYQADDGLTRSNTAIVELVVEQAPAFGNGNAPPPGTIGNPYAFQFQASGSPPPTFALAPTAPAAAARLASAALTCGTDGTIAGLPPGLTLDADGLLSGTPTTVGTFEFSVIATNDAGSTTGGPFSITISGSSALVAHAAHSHDLVQLTTSSLPSATVGVPYVACLAATGGTAPYAWSSSQNLPDGLGIDSSTGLISGAPTRAGSVRFNVKVTDAAHGVDHAFLSIEVSMTTVFHVGNWRRF